MGGPMERSEREPSAMTPSANAYPVTDAGFIPKQRYLDPDFFQLELDRLWPRVWQVACRLEELPAVGDFAEYVIDDQSILVVRTAAGPVKAYFNACRHRATELAKGSGTFGAGLIVCPFHGWRWTLDGANSFVYGREDFPADRLTPESLCLRECRVDVWAACVWVNLDPDAKPLNEALGPIPGLLDPLGIDRMRVRWWKSTILHANWKLAQEAFMEGYHVMQTHPQLTLGHPDDADPDDLEYAIHPGGHSHFQNRARRSPGSGPPDVDAIIESSRLLWEGLDAMTLERDVRVIEGMRDKVVPEGSSFGAELVKHLYEEAAAAGIVMPPLQREAIGRWGGMFFAFPNYFVLPQYGNALIYRVRPHGPDPECCQFELWSVTLPAGDAPQTRPEPRGPFRPDDADAWPQIPLQDFSNIERQQRGLHSRSVRGMRLSMTYEAGIANMHRELDRYLAS